MLHRRALYFCRSDQLGDAWEGAFPAGASEVFAEMEAKARAQGSEEAATKDWRTAWEKAYERQRWGVFANCWQIREHDVPAMWDRYGGQFGVAIKSTYQQLDAAVPTRFEYSEILLGLVTYGNYDSLGYKPDVSNMLAPFMSKRLQYAEEREVRIIFNRFTLNKTDAAQGHFVPIDLTALVAEIVVSPSAPEWFESTVSATCRAFNCQFSVSKSALGRPPRHRF